MLLMMIFPFVAYPLVTVSITILNTIGLVIVLLFVLTWRRAASHVSHGRVTPFSCSANLRFLSP
jgi:BASS family bile acid:Na+ symporter